MEGVAPPLSWGQTRRLHPPLARRAGGDRRSGHRSLELAPLGFGRTGLCGGWGAVLEGEREMTNMSSHFNRQFVPSNIATLCALFTLLFGK